MKLLQRVFQAYRRLSPEEWSLQCARGASSGLPLIGGLLAGVISPAIEEMAKQEASIIVAAGTLQNGAIDKWAGVSGVVDNEVGDYFVLLATACEDYVVHAQCAGAYVEILDQDPQGFGVMVLDHTTHKPIERPVKFVVLNATV